MSDVNVKLTMYTDQVRITANNASQKAVDELAFSLEAGTKAAIQANGQIDTGFMMNSVYAITGKGTSYGQAWGSGNYRSRKTGDSVKRNLAPKRNIGFSDTPQAAVVVGADYAIYQEQRRSFLYRAAEALVRSAGGTVQRVFKSYGF